MEGTSAPELDDAPANFKEIAGLEVVYDPHLNIALARDDCEDFAHSGWIEYDYFDHAVIPADPDDNRERAGIPELKNYKLTLMTC